MLYAHGYDYALPFPLSLIIGFFGSLEEILISALSLPADVGVNMTVIAHEVPFATVEQALV